MRGVCGRQVGLGVRRGSERRSVGRVGTGGEILVGEGVAFVGVVADAEGLGVEVGVTEGGLDDFEEEGDWEEAREKRESVE